jgi:hypothetical protein
VTLLGHVEPTSLAPDAILNVADSPPWSGFILCVVSQALMWHWQRSPADASRTKLTDGRRHRETTSHGNRR